MATATTRWTAAMVHALPDDGNRYEVIDGELFVTPAPSWRHQAASRALFLQLHAHLAAHALAEAISAPADVEFAEDRMVGPDLFVVPLVGGRAPRTWEEAGRLLLAVEIVSPSTARADRQVRRRLHQRQGGPEYWIVDVDARLVERWRPADERPELLTERLMWRPDPAARALEIDLEAYFAGLDAT
ncbi:MAG TPA: Uma2 family endonuclease [Gemmatimonadaceae bacterium]|nr:Uma2 family endonuclease [Gemmatimonadaceae bacterium]